LERKNLISQGEIAEKEVRGSRGRLSGKGNYGYEEVIGRALRRIKIQAVA
jgi:hypothetical protein